MSYVYNGTVIEKRGAGKVYFNLENPVNTAKIYSGTQTASGNQADSVPAMESTAVLVTVVVSAVSGTTPLLTVSLQDSATSGGTFVTEARSASISAAGTYQFVATLQNGFYRWSTTISGTTPSFTFSITATPFYIGSE